MSKNIIVCSDGTGNTAIMGRATNVFKLFEAVDLNGHRTNPHLTPQIAIYDDGVGTENFKPLKIFAGATGFGLARNVRQLYKELSRLYDPGDRIFLFGFSRGAFTVRTLAGLIGRCGILDISKLDLSDGVASALKSGVKKAYKVYRRNYRTELAKLIFGKPDPSVTARFREQYCCPCEVPIAFIGVWDTVDAVGTPFHISDFINLTIHRFKFPDHYLGACVERACHALSIDDERHSFHPLLWHEDPRIEQVWFAGAHSNVGGGYAKHGMSLVTLDWMLQKASESGLRLLSSDRSLYHEHANVDDKLYDPRAGLGVFYRWKPRDIEALCRARDVQPVIHASVLDRITHGTEDYAPGNLPPNATVVNTPAGDQAKDEIAAERAHRIESVLHAAHRDGRSLLSQVRSAVAVGRLSYYVYLISCTAVLIAAVVPEDSGSRLDPWAIVKGAATLIFKAAAMDFAPAIAAMKRLFMTPQLLAELVGGLLLSYLLSLYADTRMSSHFSKFWHEVQPKLRDALKSARKAAAAKA